MFGGWRRGLEANQVQFASIQQLPLDLIAGVEANGGGQGLGKTYVEPGFLPPRTKGLDFQGIGGLLHFF